MADPILTATTATIAGREIAETLGLVRGATVRARHVGADIVATLRMLVGGELGEYTKMMAGAREQAHDRMIAQAREMGADAVVELRFATSMVARGTAEILCYGTAVRLARP